MMEFTKSNLPWLPERTILLTKSGSQAYGTSTPTSDLDVKGVAVAPKEYYLGFLKRFEQAEFREPADAVIAPGVEWDPLDGMLRVL